MDCAQLDSLNRKARYASQAAPTAERRRRTCGRSAEGQALRGIRGSQPNRRLGHGRGAWRQAADRSPGPRERASNRYRA